MRRMAGAMARASADRRTLRLDRARPSLSRTMGQGYNLQLEAFKLYHAAYHGNLLEVFLSKICAGGACHGEEFALLFAPRR